MNKPGRRTERIDTHESVPDVLVEDVPTEATITEPNGTANEPQYNNDSAVTPEIGQPINQTMLDRARAALQRVR